MYCGRNESDAATGLDRLWFDREPGCPTIGSKAWIHAGGTCEVALVDYHLIYPPCHSLLLLTPTTLHALPLCS